jgi:G3E family GTPase
MSMTPSGPEFVVLTGFLGSGKTTLLRDFLATPEGANTAVIVNEAGEIGLDGAILRESGAGVSVAMLANGCICCQMGSDLATTVDALLAAERPDATDRIRRIVLETSGLSKPGPVLRQLASLAEHRMRVAVLATYDATRGMAVAAFEEAAAQWAAAQRIVVTKTDAASPTQVARAADDIAALNPLADRVAGNDRADAVRHAFSPIATAAPLAAPRLQRMASHPRITVSLARPRDVPAYDDLAAWLDNLAGALGDRLLRVKGVLRVREAAAPLLVQSVGTLFAPPRPFPGGDAAEPFLVIIARDAAEQDIAAVAPVNLFAVGGAAAEAMAAAPAPSIPATAGSAPP